ncbi:MAG: hypothetical protein L3J81_05695 [Thermoplasmata archaeon]|nr:hypothetical protein [Thermoplasmata archaeon]MCI4370802.1 hypothetical protein [Thermoplasmata archaeon]
MELLHGEIPPRAIVLAATELYAPAAGWTSPHRLAIAEGSESVRILAIVRGPLPALGGWVTVRTEGGLYYAESVAATGIDDAKSHPPSGTS